MTGTFCIRLIMCFCLSCLPFRFYAQGNSVRILPDSSNQFVQFEISRVKKSVYTIQLTDQKGQVLIERKEEISETPKLVTFNWKGFQPGIYFIKLDSKKEELKLMFIKPSEEVPALSEAQQ